MLVRPHELLNEVLGFSEPIFGYSSEYRTVVRGDAAQPERPADLTARHVRIGMGRDELTDSFSVAVASIETASEVSASTATSR